MNNLFLPGAVLRRATLACALAACVGLAGCGRKSDSGAEEKAPAPSTPAPAVPAEIWKEFSGAKAFAHVEAQVALGPRPAGSNALEKARGLIAAELERNGWSVQRQQFKEETPRGPVVFINLIARYPKGGGGGKADGGNAKTQRFLVCSHYDTKVYDTIRFLGANDGGSSTGALMELSRVLALDPALARQVELVFFDGEEAVSQFTKTDGLYGSRHYARDLRSSGRNRQFKAGVLWDMIGDKELTITLSPDSPPELTRAIFDAAEQIGARGAFSYFDRHIEDDHIPLTQVQIPTIDLIDFDYPYWHTADDTLDKISPESLQTIGAVTLRWLKTASAER